jgi:tetratricopeptide (TPR) repeat protein
MLREGAQLVEALAADRPVVILLEDLHWSDESSLELLGALADRATAARLLVIATYRPVEVIIREHPLRRIVARLKREKQCSEVLLAGLPLDDVRELLSRRLGDEDLAEALAVPLEESSAGNPFFLRATADDLAAELESSGAVLTSSEAKAWAEKVEAEVPADLAGVLVRQLRRLEEASLTALEAASVVGATFSVEEVAAASGLPARKIGGDLDRLAVAGGFVRRLEPVEWPDGTLSDRYRFEHALYRQVLLQRVAPQHLRRMHARIADRLEHGFRAAPGRGAGQIAERFFAAGELERAVPYFEGAIADAFSRRASHEAAALLSSLLNALQKLPPSPARTYKVVERYVHLGNTLVLARGTAGPGIEEAFDIAYRLAKEHDLPVLLIQAQMGRALCALSSGLPETRQRMEELLDLVERGGVRPLEPIVCAFAATERIREGDLRAADALFGRAVEGEPHPDVPRGLDPKVYILGVRSVLLALLGRAEAARDSSSAARERAAEIGHSISSMAAALMSALSSYLLGAEHEAAPLVREAAELVEEGGIELWSPVVRGLEARLGMGDRPPSETVEVLSSCLAEHEQRGHEMWNSLLLLWSAEAELQGGAFAASRRFLERAFEDVERTYLADLHRVAADVALAEGDAQAARAELEKSVDVAREQGAELFEDRALRRLAALQPSGD